MSSTSGLYWLSFADENTDTLRGVCIVKADSEIEAIMICNLRGISPHGQVLGGLWIENAEEDTIPELKSFINKCLSRKEALAAERIMKEVVAAREVDDMTPRAQLILNTIINALKSDRPNYIDHRPSAGDSSHDFEYCLDGVWDLRTIANEIDDKLTQEEKNK